MTWPSAVTVRPRVKNPRPPPPPNPPPDDPPLLNPDPPDFGERMSSSSRFVTPGHPCGFVNPLVLNCVRSLPWYPGRSGHDDRFECCRPILFDSERHGIGQKFLEQFRRLDDAVKPVGFDAREKFSNPSPSNARVPCCVRAGMMRPNR